MYVFNCLCVFFVLKLIILYRWDFFSTTYYISYVYNVISVHCLQNLLCHILLYCTSNSQSSLYLFITIIYHLHVFVVLFWNDRYGVNGVFSFTSNNLNSDLWSYVKILHTGLDVSVKYAVICSRTSVFMNV